MDIGIIKSFAHKGLEKFYTSGSTSKIAARHAEKLRQQLTVLNLATKPQDVDVPGWKLHLLNPRHKGQWAIAVNGNWRVAFYFEGTDVMIVDYQDYH